MPSALLALRPGGSSKEVSGTCLCPTDLAMSFYQTHKKVKAGWGKNKICTVTPLCSSQAAPSRPILLESCGGQGMLGETHGFVWCCWGCMCRNTVGKADTLGLGAASGSLGLLYHKTSLPLELFVMQFGLNMVNTAFSLIHLRPKV